MADRQLLSSVAERLIVASTPMQTLFMRLHSISHWEQPMETAGYMALYFFLLFFSYLTRALVRFQSYDIPDSPIQIANSTRYSSFF